MVDDAVNHGGGDDLVAEDIAPAGEGQVGRQDQRGVFVAAGYQLEEQVRGVSFERDVSGLVDDDEPDAVEKNPNSDRSSLSPRSEDDGDTVVATVAPWPVKLGGVCGPAGQSADAHTAATYPEATAVGSTAARW